LDSRGAAVEADTDAGNFEVHQMPDARSTLQLNALASKTKRHTKLSASGEKSQTILVSLEGRKLFRRVSHAVGNGAEVGHQDHKIMPRPVGRGSQRWAP
jgi:hypothetical protein